MLICSFVKVAIMKSYMTGGITDISPVINTYTDALLDIFPQVSTSVLLMIHSDSFRSFSVTNSVYLKFRDLQDRIKISGKKIYDPDAILGPLPAHGPLFQDPCVDCSPSPWDCLWAALYWTCQEIICYLFEKYKLLGGSSISDMPRDNVLSFHNILWAPGFLILNLRHINTFIHL